MKKVYVLVNRGKDPDFAVTKPLINFLKSMNCCIALDEGCNDYPDLHGAGAEISSISAVDQSVSLIVSIGGDGSLIKAASAASAYDIPIVGINLGRVGYLSEIGPSEICLLQKFFDGDYSTQSRMMLTCELWREEKQVLCIDSILNDIVLARGTIDKLAQIDLNCDGEFIGSYHADGLLVATPTGSTAYSLASGGPIIDPSVNCLCMTPICGHSMYSKAIIFPHSAQLSMRNTSFRNPHLYLSCDGNNNGTVLLGDTVIIKKSKNSAKFLTLKKRSSLENLRLKLQN